MLYRKLFIFTVILFWPFFVYTQEFGVGAPAPYFKVTSGDNEEITLDNIKGKVGVIFYETKDTIEKNRQLKNELNKFYASQPDSTRKLILRIPIINCKGVFFTDIWKNNLKGNSQKEGITIYGDWDGKMFLSYGVKDAESNLIIVGKDGVVKYSFMGKVPEKDFSKIKNLLIAESGL